MCKECIQIIKEATGIKKWKEIKKDLVHIATTTAEDEWGHCICGHEIRTEHEIQHEPSGECFIIGSSCIKQLIQDKESEVYKKCLYQRCGVCDKNVARDRFKKHCEGKKHKELEEKKKNEKRCGVCLCIMAKKDWREICKPCFMMTKYNKKMCVGCKKYNIKGDTDYKQCYKCYMK